MPIGVTLTRDETLVEPSTRYIELVWFALNGNGSGHPEVPSRIAEYVSCFFIRLAKSSGPDSERLDKSVCLTSLQTETFTTYCEQVILLDLSGIAVPEQRRSVGRSPLSWSHQCLTCWCHTTRDGGGGLVVAIDCTLVGGYGGTVDVVIQMAC